jgi:hypothetical protein
MTNEFKNRIESLIKKKSIRYSQVERFKEKAEPDLNAAMEKMLAKYSSKEYVKREIDLGYYEPRETLLWLAFEYAEKYCKECDDKHYHNMFTSAAYYFGNYVIQLIHGQGSVILVDKIEYEIKPTQKELLVDQIENRIKCEYLKHANNLPDEWAKIAAIKIVASLNKN